MTALRPMPLVVYAHMAQKCCDLQGRTRMASELGCDVEDMLRMCRGQVAPSSRQRDLLDLWFASLLGRELEERGLSMSCACEGEDKRREAKEMG